MIIKNSALKKVQRHSFTFDEKRFQFSAKNASANNLNHFSREKRRRRIRPTKEGFIIYQNYNFVVNEIVKISVFSLHNDSILLTMQNLPPRLALHFTLLCVIWLLQEVSRSRDCRFAELSLNGHPLPRCGELQFRILRNVCSPLPPPPQYFQLS